MKSYLASIVLALSCMNVLSYTLSSKTSDRKAFLQTIGATILGNTLLNPSIASAEEDKLTDVYFGVG